jgi:hypothetical protein
MKKFISPNWKILRKLSSSLVQAWFYIWDQSDACGVYVYDEDYLAVDLGEKISFDELLQLPNVKDLGGGKILLLDYIEVNYVTLKHDYNPHKPAFRSLEKNNLMLNSSLNQACIKLEKEDEDKDEKEDEDKKEDEGKKKKQVEKFVKPAQDDIFAYMIEYTQSKNQTYAKQFLQLESSKMFNYYESKGWTIGKSPMKDWKATTRNWLLNQNAKNNPQTSCAERPATKRTIYT